MSAVYLLIVHLTTFTPTGNIVSHREYIGDIYSTNIQCQLQRSYNEITPQYSGMGLDTSREHFGEHEYVTSTECIKKEIK